MDSMGSTYRDPTIGSGLPHNEEGPAEAGPSMGWGRLSSVVVGYEVGAEHVEEGEHPIPTCRRDVLGELDNDLVV